MSDNRTRLPFPLRVGATKTIIVATTVESGDSAGDDKNPSTGSVYSVFDPDRQTRGTCTSTGTTATLVDTSRTEADDFWADTPLALTDESDGKIHYTRITTSSTTTLAFHGLPVTPAAGDKYVLGAYPLKTQTAVNTSGHNGTFTLTPGDATMYAGMREVYYHPDFGTDDEVHIIEVEVLP
jgi:hypothetical protein